MNIVTEYVLLFLGAIWLLFLPGVVEYNIEYLYERHPDVSPVAIKTVALIYGLPWPIFLLFTLVSRLFAALGL